MKYIVDVPEDKIDIDSVRTFLAYGDMEMTPYEEPKYTAEDAWELAQKFSEMTAKEWAACLDIHDGICTLSQYTFEEAREKYEAWQKAKDEIKVGDEVVYGDGKAVALDFVMNAWFILTDNGIVTTVKTENIECKTGRHFDEISRMIERLNK